MTQRDFWRNSTVAVIGGGSWGTVLAHLVSQNCSDVRVWVRDEERARTINATKANPDYISTLELGAHVHAFSAPERIFEIKVHAVVWALPSGSCREQAALLARYFCGEEVVLHATKGIEDGTLKRVSQILREELPCRRIGVISGPNLAEEIAKNEPAATVVASVFDEVIEAGQILLSTDRMRVYGARDVVGVEWASALKNILAIAAGALDAMKFGWNTRALLITRGLAEMVRFGVAMGAQQSTFLGLAGVGDLLATCNSALSRNYRVGLRLASGENIESIMAELGSVAEGVRTTKIVWEFARDRGISMPITESVYNLLHGGAILQQALHALMTRPASIDES
jgi:glycerol-3-phosphate dehydrogenase (NAD(P)+)